MAKRKKKKDKKPLTTACIYCKHFHDTTKRYENGKHRICAMVDRQVSSSDENCEHFELHRYVWCPEFKKWFINSVCSQRSANTRPCNKCKVGEFVRKTVPTKPEPTKPDLTTHTPPGPYQKIELPARFKPTQPIILRKNAVTLEKPKRRQIELKTARTSKAGGKTTVKRRQITL